MTKSFIDNINSYSRAVWTIGGIIGVIVFVFVCFKVNSAMKPFNEKMALAESKITKVDNKLDNHLGIFNRTDPVGRVEFELIVSSMKENIKTIKEYQENMSIDQSKLAQEMVLMNTTVNNNLNKIIEKLK